MGGVEILVNWGCLHSVGYGIQSVNKALLINCLSCLTVCAHIDPVFLCSFEGIEKYTVIVRCLGYGSHHENTV
jgi:hypothetical protein